MIPNKVNNIRQAIDYAVEIIKKYEVIVGITNFYMEKGLAGAYIVTDKNKYCLSFQKNLYGSFRWEENGVMKHGPGIPLPEEILRYCEEFGFMPMKVYADKIYVYGIKEWVEFVTKRKDSRIVLRKKEDRKEVIDSLDYNNIPISYMINYEKWIRGKDAED